jgi:type III secretion protein U
MSEKTEQPTAKKLREARERGEVAKSKDFTQTALILAFFGYIVSNGKSISEQFGRMMLMPLPYLDVDFGLALSQLIEDMLREGVSLLLPFLMIAIGVGIFAEVIQTGVLISFKAVMPSAKKLDIVSNAQNMVSKKNLMEFLKSIIKIAVLSTVVYYLIKGALPALMYIPAYDIANFGQIFGQLLKIMIVYTGLAYTVLSLADLAWQRFQYTKQLMMSKDEVKQEYKGMEGDPQIKSQRKALHKEMMENGAVQQAREASVLVTNPTHLAIALKYDEDATPLPLITGMGEGAVAQMMIEAALAAGVPVMQNIPLAHALHDEAMLNQYIPSDLVEPVAAVLKLVQNLKAAGLDTSTPYPMDLSPPQPAKAPTP